MEEEHWWGSSLQGKGKGGRSTIEREKLREGDLSRENERRP
jgi:hypothetical protein